MRRRKAGFRHAMAAPLMMLVAGCSAIPTPEAPPPQPVTPAPAPAPAPIPTPVGSWEDRALNNGAWRFDAGSRTAAFVPTGSGSPLLSMACSGGSIRLTSTLAGDVSLRTSAGTDRIRFEGGSASLPARDPRLDRIAFSRGRFALESPDGAGLTLPVQSEIGRVIEDCR